MGKMHGAKSFRQVLLILGARRDVAVGGQMRRKSADLRLAHVRGVALAVEEDELPTKLKMTCRIAALTPTIRSQFTVAPVPEPTAASLLLAGACGCLGMRRRRKPAPTL